MTHDGLGFVVSCEHAGNHVPERYESLFARPEGRAALTSHRGWDPGALEVAERVADALGVDAHVQRVSRLVIECNRSLGHPRLFSEFSRGLPEVEREPLIREVWLPYRAGVRQAVTELSNSGPVLHLGVHTFTPLYRKKRRSTVIGLLYDPAREAEDRLARAWQRELRAAWGPPNPRGIHRNRPYFGRTDGLTTTLRSEFSPGDYLGLELEISQALARCPARTSARIITSLTRVLERHGGLPSRPEDRQDGGSTQSMTKDGGALP